MGTFLDSTDVALIAFLLGMGAILVIHSVRRLRRGDEVTAEEAVKWRRTVRKLGFDASPDMNPAITDILVRAWRTANGWIRPWLRRRRVAGGDRLWHRLRAHGRQSWWG